MSSLQSLRELISERLAAAAEEIFRLCEGTIVQYEQELCRQRRPLDICWKPQLQLHHIALHQHWLIEEEDLCNQQRNFGVDQEAPELPQIEEEQEEPQPPQAKEEQEEGEHPQIEEKQEKPEPPHIKEEQEERQHPQIEEEQEGFCISQYVEMLNLKQESDTLMEIPIYEAYEHSEADLNDQQSFNLTDGHYEELLDLKQETDILMGIPICEESEHCEAYLNNQQNFNVTDGWDEEGKHHEESTLTTDEEKDPQNRDLRNRTDRRLFQNVDRSHISEGQCDSHVRKNVKKKSLAKKHKTSSKGKRPSHIKFDKKTKVAHSVNVKLKTESDKSPHVCKECGKVFNHLSQFKAHVRRHTIGKRFSCKECDKTFSYKCHVRVHMSTHTGEKPFHCKECDKTFNYMSKLASHMKTHTGEKPYPCKVCHKSFSHTFNLKTHMKIHTGEKPFSCNECDKSFGVLAHLKTHMKIHTGEKPFSCNECDKSFAVLARLKSHMKTHTREKQLEDLRIGPILKHT